MTVSELADELRRMHQNAPRGEQSAAVVLFGIYYAADLAPRNIRIQSVVERAGLPTYATEVNKGMKLAPYVQLNDRIVAHGLQPCGKPA